MDLTAPYITQILPDVFGHMSALAEFLLSAWQDPVGGAARERWSGQLFQEPKPTAAEGHMFDLDCFLSDISDTLFTMTQKSCPWPEDGHNSE